MATVFYYNRNCPNCRNLYQEIEKGGLAGTFQYVEVNRSNCPPFLTSVPTIVTPGEHGNEMYAGNFAFQLVRHMVGQAKTGRSAGPGVGPAEDDQLIDSSVDPNNNIADLGLAPPPTIDVTSQTGGNDGGTGCSLSEGFSGPLNPVDKMDPTKMTERVSKGNDGEFMARMRAIEASRERRP